MVKKETKREMSERGWKIVHWHIERSAESEEFKGRGKMVNRVVKMIP